VRNTREYINRKNNNAIFTYTCLYGNFNTFTKRKKKKTKNEETKRSSYLGNAWHDLFEIWGTDVGGHLHSKNRPVSYKQHEVETGNPIVLKFGTQKGGIMAHLGTKFG